MPWTAYFPVRVKQRGRLWRQLWSTGRPTVNPHELFGLEGGVGSNWPACSRFLPRLQLQAAGGKRKRKSQPDKDSLVYTWTPAWIKHEDNSRKSEHTPPRKLKQDAQAERGNCEAKRKTCHNADARCSPHWGAARTEIKNSTWSTVRWWSRRQICRVRTAEYLLFQSAEATWLLIKIHNSDL